MKSTARAFNIISNANPGPLCAHERTEDINNASSVALIFTQFCLDTAKLGKALWRLLPSLRQVSSIYINN